MLGKVFVSWCTEERSCRKAGQAGMDDFLLGSGENEENKVGGEFGKRHHLVFSAGTVESPASESWIPVFRFTGNLVFFKKRTALTILRELSSQERLQILTGLLLNHSTEHHYRGVSPRNPLVMNDKMSQLGGRDSINAPTLRFGYPERKVSRSDSYCSRRRKRVK